MESRNMYVLVILGCTIIIAVFLILGLDKVIIKPLIKSYAIEMHPILDQSKLSTLATNISDLDSYGK